MNDRIAVPATHMALSGPDPKKVSVYAEILRRHIDGSVTFRAINGEWTGIFKNNQVYIRRQNGLNPIGAATVMWYGTKVDGNYNQAIAAIQAHLENPETPVPLLDMSRFRRQHSDGIPF